MTLRTPSDEAIARAFASTLAQVQFHYGHAVLHPKYTPPYLPPKRPQADAGAPCYPGSRHWTNGPEVTLDKDWRLKP